MELKPYQQGVINDLEKYLDYLKNYHQADKAFNKYWEDLVGVYNPITNAGMKPYNDSLNGIPAICLKVPTAGGKTFIACNAINTIYNAYSLARAKIVVWLVPSRVILTQTLNNLKNPEHPYRQKLNTLFGHRVEVHDKESLLSGQSLNTSSFVEELNILVLSFDSLRSKNKEDRKIYQENGNLKNIADYIGNNADSLSEHDDTALINIIRATKPVIIVDESHNATSQLSLEMLSNLNPSFILELTATPRESSNIISFVPAIELKKENMIKLPVIVSNYHDKSELIANTIGLRNKLEEIAKEQEKQREKYIRPIVLFQAQPKSDKDNETFEKIKIKLIELGIPKDEIKIKTANLDEIKNENLLSKTCSVRYIITVNALKEGWDCPFAYILASLANRSSAIDVEQILGRVLRKPYVSKQVHDALDMSYVLTSSSDFLKTLQSIVKGLTNSGFSEKDYRVSEEQIKSVQNIEQLALINNKSEKFDSCEELQTISVEDIQKHQIQEKEINKVDELLEKAIEENQNYNKKILEESTLFSLPIGNNMKQYLVKEEFKSDLENILLPQFYIETPSLSLFGNTPEKILDKDELLSGFKLSEADLNINFESLELEIRKIDIEEQNKQFIPIISRLDSRNKEYLKTLLINSSPEKKVKTVTETIVKLIGNMYPIADQQIKFYTERIVQRFSSEQVADFIDNEYKYTEKIKQKIRDLAKEYQKNEFERKLKLDQISLKPSYKLKDYIQPTKILEGFAKTFYEKEDGNLNNFEKKFIDKLEGLENIKWWHRNGERGKGFYINGFVNHYPDFIICTNSNKIIVIETKGDQFADERDNKLKIKLGNIWDDKSEKKYKCFMVFESAKVEGAYCYDNFIEVLKDI